MTGPTPPSRPWVFTLVLGVVLMGLGGFLGVRPLFTHWAVLTGARWLDVTFAVVFLFRGWLNVKTALRRREASANVR
jgi:uncharacterized membrane protein HdeD (DUF308 family)